MNKKTLLFILAIGIIILTARVLLQPSTQKTQPNEVVRIEHHVGEPEFRVATDITPIEASTQPAALKLSAQISEFPTMNDMQDLSVDEVHGTPRKVIEAGQKIGSMIEEAEAQPSKQEPTLRFFLSCAEHKDIVPAIRALCWNKAMTQMPRWNKPVPLSEYDVPIEIKTLAGKI